VASNVDGSDGENDDDDNDDDEGVDGSPGADGMPPSSAAGPPMAGPGLERSRRKRRKASGMNVAAGA